MDKNVFNPTWPKRNPEEQQELDRWHVTRDLDMEKLESTRHNARQDATERGCETD